MDNTVTKIILGLSKREKEFFSEFSNIDKNKSRSNYLSIYNHILCSGNFNISELKKSYNDDNFFDITIYDRWGAIIYYSKDINEGWNGRINNTEAKCTAGVYIWVIITRDIDGFYHKQYGNVTLVR